MQPPNGRSDEFRPLRRRRLRDVCVEPDLVAIGIKDLERPITPPLQGERITDGNAFLVQTVVERVDITATNFSLDGMDKLVAARADESRAYIVSFCGNLNLAGQWLHYGRSGSGVAVGFYPERLTQPPYDLFRIVYRLDAQVEAINTIVRTIDDALGESLPTIEDEHQRDRLRAVAADLAADHLWMASPKLKHPSFDRLVKRTSARRQVALFRSRNSPSRPCPPSKLCSVPAAPWVPAISECRC